MKWTERFKRNNKHIETTVVEQIQEERQIEIEDDTESTSELVTLPRSPWPQRNGSFPVLPSRRLSTDTTRSNDEVLPGNVEPRRLGRSGTWSLSSRSRDTSADRRYDPLGLTVLHTPAVKPGADIIFVHGLGGSSRQTWSKDRNPLLFWPKEWLPAESDIAEARISTFGYNSQFNVAGSGSISNTSDFARDLLFSLKYGQDGCDNDLGMGKAPIIFVVHSMGGIVFKRAFCQGHDNPAYSDIVSQVRAVLFLSTPHRGTDLAKALNRVLSASLGSTPKEFISELQRNSSTIEDTNEQFRHHAEQLKIFSFYETLRTQVGPKNIMVLQRDSSTLGYPGEICDPLDADHHDVCKFSSREDPSYKSVLSALKSVVVDLRKSGKQLSQEHLKEDMTKVSCLLSIDGAPEDDYLSLIDHWVPGTSGNVLSSPAFDSWSNMQSSGPEIIWVHGRPGSGKSMITASVISHLSESPCICSYFFFKFSDTTKQSCSSLLRSIAYQIAKEAPLFRAALVKLADDGLDIKKLSFRMIWEKLFVSLLFTLEMDLPLVWIIDALDESNDVNNILGIISNIHLSKTPIKIFCTNRKSPESAALLQRNSKLLISTISADDNSKDIALYANTEMTFMHGTEEFRNEIVDKIVQKSEGSFLWVHLAIKDIMRCHQEDDVREALEDFPGGMVPLYERMEKSISQLSRSSDKAIARGVLSWAAYSRVPLDVETLSCALSSDLRSIIDFRHTVTELCGGFVVIDAKNRVTLVHQTARAYLLQEAHLPFEFSPQTIHEDLFSKSINIYLNHQIPVQSRQKPLPPCHEYAATSWAYHLQRSSSCSNKSLDLLVKFFKGRWVLHWIYALTSCGYLDSLISSSSILTTFVNKRRKFDSDKSPLMHRLLDLEVIELWALDLMKIVGKFGGHLLQSPESISKILPQLCPTKSVLHRQFGGKAQLTIRGLSNVNWDDSLARILVGTQIEAYAVTSSSLFIAVADDQGSISLWNSLTFTHSKTFAHAQRVVKICFSSSGDMLASCGFSSTVVWEVQTGHQLHIIPNSKHCHVLSLTFAAGDAYLLAGLDPAKAARFTLQEPEKGWQDFGPSLAQEDIPEQGAFANSPNMVAFDKDIAHVAVCYRRFPLTVWTLAEPDDIQQCYRTTCRSDMVPSSAAWSGVTCFCWHPEVGDILGVYDDGIIFRWNPFSELYQELRTDSTEPISGITCSADGKVFATSDSSALRIYDYQHMSLIYHLHSEDYITGFCFSIDSRQFYDLRGSYCNIWQPNVLIRRLETEEHAVDDEVSSLSTLHAPSEAWTESPVPITLIAASAQSMLVCSINDDGDIRLHDITDSATSQAEAFATRMSIEHLIWAKDGQCFTYFDLGGKIVMHKAQKVENDGKAVWSHRSIATVKTGLRPIDVRQILTHSSMKSVLLVQRDKVALWSLESSQIQARCEFEGRPRWAQHPSESQQLLAFTPSTVTAYEWTSLKQLQCWDIDSLLSNSPSLHDSTITEPGPSRVATEADQLIPKEVVYDIITSQDKSHILLSIYRSESHQKQYSHVIIIKTASLDPLHQTITPLHIPTSIAKLIQKPLGVLKDQLVFLDSSYWVCSVRLSHLTAESVQRPFFLPKDWITVKALELCQIVGDGVLLYPKGGEVAVIKSTLGAEWSEASHR